MKIFYQYVESGKFPIVNIFGRGGRGENIAINILRDLFSREDIQHPTLFGCYNILKQTNSILNDKM